MNKRILLLLVLLMTMSIVFPACSRKTENIVYVVDSGDLEITELSYLDHLNHRTEFDNSVEEERTVYAYGSIIHATYKETVIEDMNYKIHVFQGLDENGIEVILHYSVKGEREILTKYAKMKSSHSESNQVQQLSRDECYAIAFETVKSLPVEIEGIDVSLSNESVIKPNGASASETGDSVSLTRYIFSFEWALNDIVYYSAAISVYSDGDIVVIDCDPSQDNNVASVFSETSTFDNIAEKRVIELEEKIDGIFERKCIGKSIITTPEGNKYIRYTYLFSKTDNYTEYTSDVLVFIPL